MFRLGTNSLTCNPIYGPLYNFHPQHGGLYNMIRGKPFPPFYSAEWMDLVENNHRITGNDITVCSFLKSGTHWIKKILLEMMKHNSVRKYDTHKRYQSLNLVVEMPNLEFYGALAGVDAYNDWLRKTDDGCPRITHHHGTSDELQKIKHIDSNAKFIYIARNPKDVVVSLYYMMSNMPDFNYTGDWNTFCTLFLNGMTQCGDWWDHVNHWNLFYNSDNNFKHQFLWLYYEDMIDDLLPCLKRIAQHIGMENDFNECDYSSIYDKVLFKNMRQEYIANPGNLWEPLNCPTEAFMRKGIVGDWNNHFSSEMTHYYDTKTILKFSTTPNIKYYQQLVETKQIKDIAYLSTQTKEN